MLPAESDTCCTVHTSVHSSGLEQSGQMDLLMARIENAVTNNCGKRAILIGHSMGGLVSVALLQRDTEWR